MPRPRPNPHAIPPRQWYGLSEHRLRAKHQLKTEPMCRLCAVEGRIVPAEVADHIEPVIDRHGVASYERFRTGPLQSLCRAHHDSTKRKAERVGFSGSVDINGWPIDPAHPWNVAVRAADRV
jgi:hypothetical protein